MKQRDDFAGPVIRALEQLQKDTSRTAIARAIVFLRSRLTDAAIAGCHHCGEEEEPGAPCHWCGLRNRRRPVRGAFREPPAALPRRVR